MMDTSYNLSVIGIPCNQFAHQEPADNATELYNGLQYVRPGSGYIPKFKLMKKIDVNGVNETLFYKNLKVIIEFYFRHFYFQHLNSKQTCSC